MANSSVLGLVLCAVSFFITRTLTAKVRGWALSRAVLDMPNARSLHVVPTPRGGGLAIVIVVLALEALLLLRGGALPWGWAGWAATLGLALIGLADDLQSWSARWRFILQLSVCAAWAMWTLGLPGNWQGAAFSMALIMLMVWVVNLYNFMDGSDGLAATQALGASAIGGVLALGLELNDIALPALIVAGSSAGFLCWNWSPAKIFLGDVGSYFLGGQFAILSVTTAREAQLPWLWPILLAPFVVDATLTLCRRLVQGERWHTAHRSHAYQLLVQAGWSHAQLALGLAKILLLVCLPLAVTSSWQPSLARYCVLLAYVFLATIWFRIVFRTPEHPA